MPIVNIKVIEGVFSQDQKQEMIRRMTDVLVDLEGEYMRPFTVVVIEEVKSGAEREKQLQARRAEEERIQAEEKRCREAEETAKEKQRFEAERKQKEEEAARERARSA